MSTPSEERETPSRQPFQWLGLAFGATVLLSAFLLFQVQPLISKAILPWFGGTPSVWTTCMLVFQTLLFAGYAYAHLISVSFQPRVQLAVHSFLLVVAVCLLPILPSNDWKPKGNVIEVVQVIWTLIACVGLPFFMLSTTGPMLQRWFSLVYPGRTPYRLYALSNFGSLLALISYPFVVEPLLPLGAQSIVWSVLFVLFVVHCGFSGVMTLRQAQTRESLDGNENAKEPEPTAPTSADIKLWFVLAWVPSVMLLATTNQLCLDVASIPFLWILPLSLYLISFIICFDRERWYSRTVWSLAVAFSSLAMAIVLVIILPIQFQIVAFSCGLFASAMFCHGELVRLKPDPRHLTLFYLVISAAGAAGGLFVSIIAPLVFNDYFEIHFGISATCFLVLFVLYKDRQWLQQGKNWLWLAGTVLPLVLMAVGVVARDGLLTQSDVIEAKRNFYGVLRLKELSKFDDANHNFRLYHGSTVHGAQMVRDPTQPTLYYSEPSGIGLAMRFHKAHHPRRVGIVGLGAGTISVYGKPGDTIRFYEIDDHVVDLAQRRFSYLSDCQADLEFVLGDARLMMERELAQAGSQQYDILAIDAFSSDAIPTHLLTREACEVWLNHLNGDGILAVHISNRHFQLERVVAALAREFNLSTRGVYANVSKWVLLCRSEREFEGYEYRGLSSVEADREILWTDDYCNLFSVLKRIDLQNLFATTDKKYNEDVDQGIALFDAGELKKAEAKFRSALDRRPDATDVWISLGNVLGHQGRKKEAIDCFMRAIEISPRSSDAYNNLGMSLVETDYAKAVEHMRFAVLLDPRNAHALSTLGTVLMDKKQYSDAAELFRRALKVDPSFEQARAALSNVESQLSGSN